MKRKELISKGYMVDLPNMSSTNYAIREYWIERSVTNGYCELE